MGYVEKVMGDNERIVYRTHMHWTVLLGRILRSLVVLAVFLGLGLAILTPEGVAGNPVRKIVGVIILCGLILPLAWLIRNWVRRDLDQGLFRVIWRPLLVAIAMLAVGLVLLTHPEFWQVSFVWLALAVIPLVILLRVFLVWINEQYVITNRRVMEVHGIVNKHVRDSALEKVNDVDLNQSFMGRILNYGTLKIITGSDIGVNELRSIANPSRFKRAMMNAKEQLHATVPGIAAEEGIAPAPVRAPGAAEAVAAWASAVTASDIPGMIQELDDLRQKGVISEEEFQAKKKELLARL